MLLGVNQVIMMAFGIVVLASMLVVTGARWRGPRRPQRVNVGLAFAPGLAIVLAAIALDRISTGERRSAGPAVRRIRARCDRSEQPGAATAAAIGLTSPSPSSPRSPVPTTSHRVSRVDLAEPINDAVGWVNDHFRAGVPGGRGHRLVQRLPRAHTC